MLIGAGYILHGKLLMELRQGTDTLHFFYDAQSHPMMVKYGSNYYTYLHSLQGDILAIVDSAGAKVVEYKYNAWGKPVGSTQGTMATTLGKLNPFRYRGYLFDEETGLYYLRSRYYNPEWGRFINADSLLGKTGTFLSHNVFAYCANNPITAIDEDGKWFMLLTAAIGAIAGAVVGGIVAISQGAELGSGDFWRDVGIGAAAGGLIGLGAGAAAAYVLTGSALASSSTVLGVVGIGASATATSVAIKAGYELGKHYDKLGTFVKNPKIVVDWGRLTAEGHGLSRMLDRGLSSQMIDSWIESGVAFQQTADKYLIISREGAAVVTATGNLVTAFAAKDYSGAFLEFVRRMWGG